MYYSLQAKDLYPQSSLSQLFGMKGIFSYKYKILSGD